MGNLRFSNGNSNSIGNDYADMLIGNLNTFQQYSFNRVNDISYKTYEGFVQDSWKVNKRLTLELGIRTHAISRPGSTGSDTGSRFSIPASTTPVARPLSIAGSSGTRKTPVFRWADSRLEGCFYQPRFGMAYDVFGNGKTVLRGGWGMYYFHSGQFTTGLDVAAGVGVINLSSNQGPSSSPWVTGGRNAAP